GGNLRSKAALSLALVVVTRLRERAHLLHHFFDRTGQRDLAAADRDRAQAERQAETDVDGLQLARNPFGLAHAKAHVLQFDAAERWPHASDFDRHAALARDRLGARANDGAERDARREQEREPRARDDDAALLEPRPGIELP